MSTKGGVPPARTLILPVYNGEKFLEANLRQVHEWLAEQPEPWELLIVDDASQDGTPGILDAFLDAHRGEAVERIRFTGNRGKGFAVRVGLHRARAPLVFFNDCDLAYPMANLARVAAALETGADAAIGCRVLPDSAYVMSPSFFHYLYTRHVLGRAFNLLCRILTVPRILDTQAGLKGFRTEAVRPVLRRFEMDGFSFDVELLRALMDRGARIAEVPVAFRYDSEPSTVAFVVDSTRMFRDLVRIRSRSLAGRYRAGSAQGSPTRLVIHADDYGLAPGINRAIETGLSSGAWTSVSILLGTPHGKEALSWAAAHPEFDFGVHLNVTRGRPLLPPDRVPSLVGPSGEFHPFARFLERYVTGRIAVAEIEAEWRAQIGAVKDAGVAVSHLDSHQHVHLLPRVFSRVVTPLATSYGFTVRAMDGPYRGGGARADLKGWLLSLASRSDLKRAGRSLVPARGFGSALLSRPTLDVVRSAIDRMAPGETYEMVVHPGEVDDALVATGDDYHHGRRLERALLESEELRAALAIAGIEVVGFRGLRG
jgi:dolichyl-phosphate beta-glucosyltransferase